MLVINEYLLLQVFLVSAFVHCGFVKIEEKSLTNTLKQYKV